MNLTKANPWLHLASQHGSIFGYYVLWLLRRPLHPFVDLSKPMHDNGLPSLANATASNIEEVVNTPYHKPANSATTIFALSNSAVDHAPQLLPPARRLLHAYFLGHQLGVPHFQDAVMNNICTTFVPSAPPTPASVKDIYERSGAELSGLKKFCVDYYIFHQSAASDRASNASRMTFPAANNDNNNIKNETNHDSQLDAVHHFHQVPPLKNYPPAFFRDVTKTVSDLRTTLPTKVKRMTPFDRVRKQYKDMQVDFSNLGPWLRDGDEGRQKCRYHQHGKGALCLNRIT